jgi:threonine/homoserine/homoserine lactone efflux protein
MIPLLLSSLALGIAFCAPPGVVTAEAVRRGLARGFWPALRVELGSLVGDAAWAIIALTGVAFLVQNSTVRLLLGIAGTLLLLFLAYTAIQDAKKGAGLTYSKVTNRNDFLTGALLSLGNPFAVAFWLGVGSSTITASVPEPEKIHYLVFFLAFMTGGFIWSFFLAGMITWGRQFLNAAFFRWVNIFCGLFMAYFAVQLFLRSVFSA